MTIAMVASALACAVFVQTVDAWGSAGHKVICRIALQRLGPVHQHEIRSLAKAYATPEGARIRSFEDGCFLADRARARAQEEARDESPSPRWGRFLGFGPWHFLNVPRDARRVETAHCGGGCVLTGIEYHGARLADRKLGEPERAEALLLLAHWIGDVHQPLHVGYGDDAGGNDIRLDPGSRYYRKGKLETLHAVWDGGLVAEAGHGDWRAMASSLLTGIDAREDQARSWLGGTPLDWAQESYDIATRASTGYCEWKTVEGTERCVGKGPGRNLADAYQQASQRVVEVRLQQAGVRLARAIADALGPPGEEP